MLHINSVTSTDLTGTKLAHCFRCFCAQTYSQYDSAPAALMKQTKIPCNRVIIMHEDLPAMLNTAGLHRHTNNGMIQCRANQVRLHNHFHQRLLPRSRDTATWPPPHFSSALYCMCLLLLCTSAQSGRPIFRNWMYTILLGNVAMQSSNKCRAICKVSEERGSYNTIQKSAVRRVHRHVVSEAIA